MIAFLVWRRAHLLMVASENDDPGSRKKKLLGKKAPYSSKKKRATIICLFRRRRQKTVQASFLYTPERGSVNRFFFSILGICSNCALFRAHGGVIRERLARPSWRVVVGNNNTVVVGRYFSPFSSRRTRGCSYSR